MSPVVSVIMAAYNAEATIASAVDSVMAQTFRDFELIVVDDASSDRTLDIARAYGDPRIRVVRHSVNRGPAAARNTALEIAGGRWATVLDADDGWHAERLERLVAVAHRHPDAVIGDEVWASLSDREGRLVPWRSEFAASGLALTEEVTECDFRTLIERKIDIKPLFPLDVIRERNIRMWEEAFGAEWLEFIAQLVSAGLKIHLVNQPLYYYRQSRTNLSSRYGELLREILVCERLQAMRWLDDATMRAVERRKRFLQQRRPWVALRNRLWRRAISDLVRYPGSLGLLFTRLPAVLSRARLARQLEDS